MSTTKQAFVTLAAVVLIGVVALSGWMAARHFRKPVVKQVVIPNVKFYLFGMGPRQKMVYRDGKLIDAITHATIRSWSVASEQIDAPQYTVRIRTRDGADVAIIEDESGVWVEQNGTRAALSQSQLKLPTFEGNPHAKTLRVLHQEILFNIKDGKPLPNIFAYERPWYRDSAMICMVLEKTGNLDLVRDWALGISDPYDHNNADPGQSVDEPDNLGQVLFIISLFADRNHPIVAKVLAAAKAQREENHLTGSTDQAAHPVYQTKWMKFGLKRLGLSDDWEIPKVFDSYSALFWWDFKDQHIAGPRFDRADATAFPYLSVAESHFYGEPLAPGVATDVNRYPQSWEAFASNANYDGVDFISPEMKKHQICLPHTWHAAELFLYYYYAENPAK